MRRTILALIVMFTALHGAEMDFKLIAEIEAELLQRCGEAHRFRIERGVRQVAALWRQEDGASADFAAFCRERFIGDDDTLRLTLARLERNLEILLGHAHEVSRELKVPLELDVSPLLPVDYLFAEYDPFAHINDDLFRSKIAFVVLLNFPVFSLEEKLALGQGWSREQWAMARLADFIDARVPAEVSQELSKAYVQADDYIANYNITMNRLLFRGERLFPPGLRLISHWGLRDELKSRYADPEGLRRQQLIAAVMERIIRGEIPRPVINSDGCDWDVERNLLFVDDKPQPFESEGDLRYEKLLQIFRAERRLDAVSPRLPSKIDRRFKKDREIAEEQVEAMIMEVLKAPVAKQIADLIAERLGRPLQPFDIWYSGFKPRGAYDEQELDRGVRAAYPTAKAFQEGLPKLLSGLGFDAETAAFLQSKIVVDPARGAGHATGAMRRDDNAHLRTRVAADGMNYKGYNIAVHELGHNVEQVFSLNRMDHYMLSGVPNTSFTEAFAFLFQSRDLALLGLPQPQDDHLRILDAYWSACEIGVVGLIDMRLWRWLYDHPQARAAEVREAVIDIARDVWNDTFYPLIGVKDSVLPAIYSHMIAYGLYLPDYFLGHIIHFQIEDYMAGKNLGREMERMCRLGRLTPDAWMKAAVGAPVSPRPLIEAVQRAVAAARK